MCMYEKLMMLLKYFNKYERARSALNEYEIPSYIYCSLPLYLKMDR